MKSVQALSLARAMTLAPAALSCAQPAATGAASSNIRNVVLSYLLTLKSQAN